MTQSLPPDLIEYEHQLTEAIGREIDARRTRRRRAVAPAAVCGAAAVAAAGIAAASLSSGGFSPQVADAAILRHAVHALDQPPDTVLHVTATDTIGPPGAAALMDTRQVWILPVPAGTPCDERPDCPAQDLRTSYQRGATSPQLDSSTGPDDVTSLYDSSTNTVYEPPSPTASWQAPESLDGQNLSGLDPFSTGFASQLQQAIDTGRAHVVGDATVDSQQVVQIAGETDICEPAGQAVPPGLPSRPSKDGRTCEQLSSWTYDVMPGSYRPVQLQNTIGATETDTISFEIWQTLPAAQNMDVFSLPAQHPGARIDDSAAGYQNEATHFDSAEGVPAIATALGAHATADRSSSASAPARTSSTIGSRSTG